jgi:hypothetical protein
MQGNGKMFDRPRKMPSSPINRNESSLPISCPLLLGADGCIMSLNSAISSPQAIAVIAQPWPSTRANEISDSSFLTASWWLVPRVTY